MQSKIKKTDFLYDYAGKQIRYSVYSKKGTKAAKIIIFLGTVQTGKTPIWVTESCPVDTVVVQGAPHWFTRADGSDTHQFMFEFTKDSFRNIRNSFSVNKVHVITDSQAAPAVMQLFSLNEYTQYLAALVMLQPLGFNTSVYSGRDQDRIKTFKKRVVANTRKQFSSLIPDSRLMYNHVQLARKVGYQGMKTKAQYNYGLMYDGIGDLKRLLSADKNVVVICGENDKLFPPDEIRNNFKKNGVGVIVKEVSNIPHSPLATKYGRRLLDKAFEYINN